MTYTTYRGGGSNHPIISTLHASATVHVSQWWAPTGYHEPRTVYGYIEPRTYIIIMVLYTKLYIL